MKWLRGPLFVVETLLLTLIVLLALGPAPTEAGLQATIRYVLDDGGADAGDCSDDQAPCQTIQYALGQASGGDTIRLANKFAPAVYAAMLTIDKPLTLEGGWNVTQLPSALLWRKPAPCEAFRTVIDAVGCGRAVTVADGVDATFECLTITRGDATGAGGGGPLGYDVGGGIYSRNGNLVVSHCVIRDSVASRTGIAWGGGIGVHGGTAMLRGNRIQGNTASTASNGYGGGVYLREMDAAEVSGNILRDNTASTVASGYGYGGGLAAHFGAVTLHDNVVYNNTAHYGGGLWTVGHSALSVQSTIRDCQIYSNTAADYGGGIYAGYGDDLALAGNDLHHNQAGLGGGAYLTSVPGGELTGNRLYTNTADYGAGLYLILSDGATLTGNYIYDNQAAGLAGGLWIYSSTGVRLANNMIVGNQLTGGGDGAGVHLYNNSTAEFLHTTLANNQGGGGQGLYIADSSTAALTNTLVAGNAVGIQVGAGCSAAMEATLWGAGSWSNGTDSVVDGTATFDPGTVVLSGDPAFVDAVQGDYHIGPASDAREAGLVTSVLIDFDGQARLGMPDIGADEYVLTAYLPLVMRQY
ncbi:MAG: right-handed parallel beta-helix repeat-containing protein [Anaerolineae bacterium]|jgi:hypothetical protein